jgi:ADP-ribose pyrophosphatase
VINLGKTAQNVYKVLTLSIIYDTLIKLLCEIRTFVHFELREGDSMAESAINYESRIAVEEKAVDWTVNSDGYQPPDFTHEVVLEGPIWADPLDPRQIDWTERFSYAGPLFFDKESGRPLNPCGRTGLAGRGLLGKWGANNAADPIVIAKNGDDLKILLVKRKDNGQWALPGGMVDPGEHVSLTAKRELQEEAGIDLSNANGQCVFEGYVLDPRNTDNAWMETAAYLYVVDASPKPHAGDDAADAAWFDLSGGIEDLEAETGGLYASHAEIIRDALDYLL